MTGLALLLIAFVQDKPDAAAELKKLEAEYSRERDAYLNALRAAKSAEERVRVEEKDPDPLFLPRFRELARRAKGTSPAAMALLTVFEIASSRDDADAMEDALKEMVASHLDSPRVEEMAVAVASANPHAGLDALLRRIGEKSPHRGARAAAWLGLGQRLLNGEPKADRAAEGRRLLESVTKDFADTSYAKTAEGRLFQMDHLQIGKTAADFEAKDQDGKAFKLSDYRGKVLVVDFWGFW